MELIKFLSVVGVSLTLLWMAGRIWATDAELPKLRKEIDDLKRELEEMKRK
jgi:hypothetical protein